MPVINQVVAETRLTMAITSARVTKLTRGLGADRWPRYRPLARNSRASLAPASATAFSLATRVRRADDLPRLARLHLADL